MAEASTMKIHSFPLVQRATVSVFVYGFWISNCGLKMKCLLTVLTQPHDKMRVQHTSPFVYLTKFHRCYHLQIVHFNESHDPVTYFQITYNETDIPHSILLHPVSFRTFLQRSLSAILGGGKKSGFMWKNLWIRQGRKGIKTV